MTRLIVDASAIGELILPDEHDDSTFEIAGVVSDADLVQPPHWPVEVCGLVLKASRRNRVEPTRLDALLDSALALIASAEVATSSFMPAVVNLALAHHISVYDAAYLELALREKLPLLTADKALRSAAAKAKVDLVGSGFTS